MKILLLIGCSLISFMAGCLVGFVIGQFHAAIAATVESDELQSKAEDWNK